MERQETGLERLRDTRELYGLQSSTKTQLLQPLDLLIILRMFLFSKSHPHLLSTIHISILHPSYSYRSGEHGESQESCRWLFSSIILPSQNITTSYSSVSLYWYEWRFSLRRASQRLWISRLLLVPPPLTLFLLSSCSLLYFCPLSLSLFNHLCRKLWDAISGLELRSFSHKRIVKAVDISKSSRQILTVWIHNTTDIGQWIRRVEKEGEEERREGLRVGWKKYLSSLRAGRTSCCESGTSSVVSARPRWRGIRTPCARCYGWRTTTTWSWVVCGWSWSWLWLWGWVMCGVSYGLGSRLSSCHLFSSPLILLLCLRGINRWSGSGSADVGCPIWDASFHCIREGQRRELGTVKGFQVPHIGRWKGGYVLGCRHPCSTKDVHYEYPLSLSSLLSSLPLLSPLLSPPPLSLDN